MQFTATNNKLKTNSILFGMFTSSATGHLLHDKEITGNPILDLIIKIAVPVTTGVLTPLVNNILTPLVREFIQTRKEKRRLKKLKK